MSGLKVIKGNRFLFPYTCPFFEPSPENEHVCALMKTKNGYLDDNPKVLQLPGCILGRKICYIMVDLYDKEHVRNADELISLLPSTISDSEAETIKLNIRDYYNKFAKENQANEHNV